MRSRVFLLATFLPACGQLLSVSERPGDDGGAPSDAPLSSVSSTSGGTREAGVFVFEPSRKTPKFFDAFDRADASDLGLGWFVKTPGSFSVRSGEAEQSSSAPLVAQDLIVLRPESVLDVEVRVTVTFAGEASKTYMLLAREQPSSERPMWVESYAMAFRSDRFQLGSTTTSSGIERSISPPLAADSRFVASLRVRGTDPVVLEAGIATIDGTMIVSEQFRDEAVSRIQQPGRVGFGGGSFGGRWDDFARFDL